MKNKKLFFSIIFLLLFANSESYSNNIRLSNFSFRNQNLILNYINIKVDLISWDNSWRNDISGTGYSIPYNYDAAWIFAKYKKKNQTAWKPVKFSPNENDYVIPPNISILPVLDSMGVFAYRSQNGSGTIDISGLQLRWYYNFNLNANDTIDLNIYAVEMVYIPQGNFYVGDGTTTNITGQFSASDNISPYQITSANQITLGGLGANSLNNRDNSGMSSPDDFSNTVTQTLPSAFPKGYNSFFCMKYEVSSQQYVDFLNTLETLQANLRFANSYGVQRNSIMRVGNVFNTTAPDRANNYMNWGDCAAYADWCGLRPMTELECEKVCRGPLTPVANEYAWGNTTVVQQTGFVGTDSSGTEAPSPVNANCNYNLIDGGAGQPIGGPVRSGIFATAITTDRVSSGASYYGTMELSGNVWERPVTVGNPTGRNFTGINGDGILAANGDANVLYWPGADAIGSGFKCGNWFRGTERLRISDRFYASTGLSDRTSHRGMRCVRTVN